MNKFTIVFQECEEGGFSAYIKEFPGAISEGETIIETAENVFDALVQVLAAQAQEELSKKKTRDFPLELELASETTKARSKSDELCPIGMLLCSILGRSSTRENRKLLRKRTIQLARLGRDRANCLG